MIILLGEEYLDEMATICKSPEYGILVAVNPDSGRVGDPYFKFYNSSNYNSATKVIRILFKKPDFVEHKDSKKLWELNTKEKKLLIHVLKSESDQHDNLTNWQVAKFSWNSEYLEEPINMKRYFKGEYDEFYKNNPGYVPSYLKMPDYKNLTF